MTGVRVVPRAPAAVAYSAVRPAPRPARATAAPLSRGRAGGATIVAAVVAPLMIVIGLLIWQPVWTLGTVAVRIAAAVKWRHSGHGAGRAVIINQTVIVGKRR